MEKKKKGSILVIGDWVIDEYWFLVQHHSDISSHTGFTHYRVTNSSQDNLRTLCGAGHIARILYERLSQDYDLYGLGLWDSDDTKLLTHLVCCDKEKCASSNGTLGYKIKTCRRSPKGINLTNLGTPGFTNRVIRSYNQDGSQFEQVNRIDWSPKNLPGIDYSKADDILQNTEFDAVVVYDLSKGFINRTEITKKISDRNPGAQWFVRTKELLPQWIGNVNEDKIKLSFIGPEITALLNPWGTWLMENRPKDLAIKTFDKIRGTQCKIIVSDSREVLIQHTNQNQKNKKIYTNKSLSNKDSVQLGWTGSLFAELTCKLISKQTDIDINPIATACIDLADKRRNISPPNSFNMEKISSIIHKKPDMVIEPLIHEEEKEKWEASKNLDNLGCIGADHKQLDVWRAMSTLPGYISCILEKEKILCDIGRQLNAFRNHSNRSRSLSIMLQADPGSGKTHLAKMLAKTFKFSLLRFDVTQMMDKSEMLDLFDSISTRQANNKSEILVFVDEINALLENQHVYSTFLAPLEEGFYSRRGRQFILKPCVWLFAGTKMIDGKKEKNQTVDERRASEKLSDFQSRMTLIKKIDFDSLIDSVSFNEKLNKVEQKARKKAIKASAQLEQVYLGALMLKRFYPDINEVSKDILQVFSELEPEKQPARTIRNLVENLRNVQYGRVTKANCDNWKYIDIDGLKIDWLNEKGNKKNETEKEEFIRVSY